MTISRRAHYGTFPWPAIGLAAALFGLPEAAELGDFAPIRAGNWWRFAGTQYFQNVISGGNLTSNRDSSAVTITVLSGEAREDTLVYRLSIVDSLYRRWTAYNFDTTFRADTVMRHTYELRELPDRSLATAGARRPGRVGDSLDYLVLRRHAWPDELLDTVDFQGKPATAVELDYNPIPGYRMRSLFVQDVGLVERDFISAASNSNLGARYRLVAFEVLPSTAIAAWRGGRPTRAQAPAGKDRDALGRLLPRLQRGWGRRPAGLPDGIEL